MSKTGENDMLICNRLKFVSSFLLSELFCILVAVGAVLAEPTVSVRVNPTHGTIDDSYVYSVIIQGSTSTSRPTLIGGESFSTALIGPQQSVNIVNGAVTQKLTYLYQLTPKVVGDLETPAVEVKIGGELFRAVGPRINVAPNSGSNTGNSNMDKGYWMQQNISASDSVFVGEQIVNNLEIITRVALLEPQLGDLTFPDFRNEALGEQENSRRVIDGKPFTVNSIRKALFPLRSGKLEIPSRDLRAKVRDRSNPSDNPFEDFDPFNLHPGSFDDFFGVGRIRDVILRSNPITLDVKPLPETKQQLLLLGLKVVPVGATSLVVDYDPSDIKFGSNKTVNITIKSEGDIQGIKGLNIESAYAKVYEEAPQAKSEEFDGKLLTTKSIKLSIVPTGAGEISLPTIAVSFFDPTTAEYKIAEGKKIKFNVVGGPVHKSEQNTLSLAETANHSTNSESTAVTPLLNYSEPTAIEKIASSVSVSLALLVLSVAIILFIGAQFIYKAARIRKNAADPYKDIKLAHSVEQLNSAVRFLLKERFNLNGDEGLMLRNELKLKIKDTARLFEIETLLDNLEACTYGGVKSELEQLKQRALQLPLK